MMDFFGRFYEAYNLEILPDLFGAAAHIAGMDDSADIDYEYDSDDDEQ